MNARYSQSATRNARPAATRKATTTTSTCQFQALEQRQLMTFIPTDMTQLAQHYPTHLGPTQLYLNFDGGNINDDQAGGAVNVSAFAAQPGADRGKAIQDIVYRVSEIFSPFNVQVRRLSGFGNYATGNGATTVFIGANPANVNTTGKNPVKTTAGFTPNNSSDYPGDIKGLAHVPNSDDYDLAFVDPVATIGKNTYTVQDDLTIAQAIGHEAGHTFGLAHTLTSPTSDVMSYDSGNRFFANKTFAITANNYDPSTGTVKQQSSVVPKAFGSISVFGHELPVPETIVTQNSFTFLAATLGKLNYNLDPYPHHAADLTAVETDYAVFFGKPKTMTLGSSYNGFVSIGSSDVFNLDNPLGTAQTVRISLSGNLNPQILLYDNTGNTLLDAAHVYTRSFTLQPYSSYKLVVGSFEGRSYGTYTLNIKSPFLDSILNSPAYKLSDLVKISKSTGYTGKFSNSPTELYTPIKIAKRSWSSMFADSTIVLK